MRRLHQKLQTFVANWLPPNPPTLPLHLPGMGARSSHPICFRYCQYAVTPIPPTLSSAVAWHGSQILPLNLCEVLVLVLILVYGLAPIPPTLSSALAWHGSQILPLNLFEVLVLFQFQICFIANMHQFPFLPLFQCTCLAREPDGTSERSPPPPTKYV